MEDINSEVDQVLSELEKVKKDLENERKKAPGGGSVNYRTLMIRYRVRR